MVKVVVVYVGLLVPTFVVPTFHWYDGVVPPLAGVAVNVTELPEHIVSAAVAICTDGVTAALITIVIELEVAVAGDAQAAVEVMTQDTACPLVSVVVV